MRLLFLFLSFSLFACEKKKPELYRLYLKGNKRIHYCFRPYGNKEGSILYLARDYVIEHDSVNKERWDILFKNKTR